MTDKPTIEDSLLLCASDLQHSAIYDNHIEMQSCIRAVADRITALVSVIDGVGRTALDALKHPAVKPDMLVNGGALKLALNVLRRAGKNEVADELECTAQAGEYPELPPLQVRYDGLGHTTTMGYGASQMRDYADATCAARKAALTTPAQAVAWPRNAAEVREFMDAHCQREERANDDSSPSDDDLYVLTAHDFLSAINSWADSPHHPGATQPAAQAQEEVPDMFWDADDTENFAHEIQDIIDGYGPGEIVTIECAKRLPNFRVVVTRDGDWVSCEYLEAAHGIAAQQGDAA